MSVGTRIQRGVFGSFLMLAKNRPVFTADYYAVDTGSNKVASFIDWNDPTHLLSQGASGQQVSIPVASELFNNRRCVVFVRANSTYYQSNRALSRWKFLSDGTPYEAINGHAHVSGTGSQVHWSTRLSSHGATQYRTVAGNVSPYFVQDGSVLINQTTGGTPGLNVASYSDTTYNSPNWSVRTKGTLNAAGTQAAIPAGNSPEFSLIWGSDGTNHSDMVAPFLWIGVPMGPQELFAMQAIIQQIWGMVP